MWDNFKVPNIGVIRVFRRIEKKEKRERRIRKQNNWRSNNWNFPKFDDNYKPTDSKLSMNAKHKKYDRN